MLVLQLVLGLVGAGFAIRSLRDKESASKRRDMFIAMSVFIVVLVANQLSR